MDRKELRDLLCDAGFYQVRHRWIIKHVKWRMLDMRTIQEALNEGNDEKVRETLSAYTDGAYI